MNILQVNTVVNSGSTGRIAEDIGKLMLQKGHKSIIAFGRGNRPSASNTIRIGNACDFRMHALKTRLFDLHGFGSENATGAFIEKVKKTNPDIIHLHNLHGYYLNVEALFKFLKQAGKPVVWTFHDCWPFTGHCSHFDFVNCYKWETQCFKCPNKKAYPASWLIDNSASNYRRKKELFTGLPDLTIVTPSKWLAGHVKKSFLKDYPLKVVHNGIDLDVFKHVDSSAVFEKYGFAPNEFVLGVAGIWSKRKGLIDFLHLRELLPKSIQIVLVGLSKTQIKKLPTGITGIERTESIQELASLYSAASVFVNPTYVDNFPTTNIEALACGTPVVTYNTGGSPESIDAHTGLVVEKGDTKGVAEAIKTITGKGKAHYRPLCRERAERIYNKDDRFMDYLRLYESLI